MKKNAFVFLLTIISALAGVQFPSLAEPVAHLPTLLVLLQLLLCFLATGNPATPLPKASLRSLPVFLIWKMLALPLGVWLFFCLVIPEYALSALLITASATAVIAPFFAYLSGADAFFVIGAVIGSSLAMPFTLPLLASVASFFDGQSAAGLVQSCLGTALYLGMCMLLPFFASKILWRSGPSLADRLLFHRFGLTLLCIAGCNFVVFAKFAEPLRAHPDMVLHSLFVCILIAALLVAFGMLAARRSLPEIALGKIIGLSCLNNVLIVIVAAEFFGLREVLVAALYAVPMLGLGIPYQLCRRILAKRQAPENQTGCEPPSNR